MLAFVDNLVLRTDDETEQAEGESTGYSLFLDGEEGDEDQDAGFALVLDDETETEE